MQHDAVAGSQFAEDGRFGPPQISGVGMHLDDLRSLLAGELHEPHELRAAHADPPLRVATDEVGHRAFLDQPSLPDHHEVVGHERHLGQEVTRHEHRATLRREVAEELADPSDPFGIEPVGRFVQDQRVGITEHDGGKAESLAHAERVSLHPLVRDIGEADHLEHLAHTRLRDAVRCGDAPEMISRGAGRVHVARIEQCTDLPQR